MVFQRDYGYMSDRPAFAGMIADPMAIETGDILSLVNSGGQARQTVGTITIGGTFSEGETVTATITAQTPTSGTVTKAIVATAGASPTPTTVATALVNAINADDDINDVLVASSAAGVVTLTVRYFNVDPVVSVAGSESSASGTITASPAVTSHTDAATIPFGYVVGQYAATQGFNECAKISTATGLTVMGIAAESKSIEAPYPYNFSTVSAYPANSTVRVVRRGRIWCPAATAIARNTVPAILNATGQLTANGAGSSTAGTGMICRSYNEATGLALIEIALS